MPEVRLPIFLSWMFNGSDSDHDSSLIVKFSIELYVWLGFIAVLTQRHVPSGPRTRSDFDAFLRICIISLDSEGTTEMWTWLSAFRFRYFCKFFFLLNLSMPKFFIYLLYCPWASILNMILQWVFENVKKWRRLSTMISISYLIIISYPRFSLSSPNL